MDDSIANGSANKSYWRANLRLLAILMAVWALVSFGAGIVFREWLDRYFIGGYPLGFWFAQQGSIYVFIVLIFVYSRAIHRLERQYALDDDDDALDEDTPDVVPSESSDAGKGLVK